MAEPSEGAYALINVASQKALDVYWNAKKYQKYVKLNARNSSWICQTWIFDKQSNGWQITNYATRGCLDASDTSSTKWGLQLKDANTTAQRWTVETDGSTFTYGSKSYPTYTIKPKSASSLYLSRYVYSNDDWINLSGSSGNAARWALIPLSSIAEDGSYYIIPESDVKSCIEIAAGSKANGAKARVSARNTTKSYQTFKVTVNDENFSIRIVNENSNKSLDIWKNAKGTAPDYVGQYTTSNSSTSQLWAVVKAGTAKFNGVTYPTYILRSVKYAEPEYSSPYAMALVSGEIKMRVADTSSKAQRFLFIPAEYLDNGLTVPGAASTTSSRTRTGAGGVTVSGIKFSSKYSKFQARYMLIKYQKNRKLKTQTNWASINGGSKANGGWGPSGTYIELTPKNGVVTIPESIFSKTYQLNSDTQVAIDFVIQVRAYSDIKKNGSVYRNARSTEKQTTLKLRQRPKIEIKSLVLKMSGDKGSGDKIGISLTLQDSLGEGCSNIKARLIGQDSIPISNWVSSTSMTLDFFAGDTLYRLPNQNEKISLKYIFVTKQDSITLNSSVSMTFSFSPSSALQIGHADSLDGSLTTLIRVTRHEADKCFMEVPFLSGTKLIPCQFDSIADGYIQWLCAPLLNKPTRIIVYSKPANSSNILYGETTLNVSSHTAIWNWGTSPKAKYTQFATLFLNRDNPPQQKRSFTTDAQFYTPAGRILPVAFSSRALNIDLSVTGVSVDEGNDYVASGPLPPHNQAQYLILLSELAGKGIHPIYRTPYGDWYQVGVSAVDVSRNAIGCSDVSVTQRALED